MATLFVVATPIGNLGDMTFRAVETLKSVATVLCEDTRETRKLMQRYEIATPTLSYHEHSKVGKIGQIIDMLKDGKDLALVSDAGTPSISDPGSFLVSEIRRELPETKIVAVPGASALTSALSIAGVAVHEFTFLGFLPHKKGRETLIKEIAATTSRTMVFYESPHRILKALSSLKEFFEKAGTPERKIVIARELTKMFEETISGSAEEILAHFEAHSDTVRGEFVVIVGPVS